MAERFPFGKLNPDQRRMLDEHYEMTALANRNCETLRDPQEQAYLATVVQKLYATLDLSMPRVYILDSPLSCAYAWTHTPQNVADRWRVFHDEFYTHPMSSPIVDVITDGYNAFTRLVEINIDASIPRTLHNTEQARYDDLSRVGDLIDTAIRNVKDPMLNDKLVNAFRKDVMAHINDPAIQNSVQRQPVPNSEHLFTPNQIFRGQHFTQTAFYQTLVDLGLPFIAYHKNLISLWSQMNKACHWWFPFKHVILISDRHSAIHVDDRGRPHNTKGPAVEYRDGWKVYAHKGILVPEQLVENPQSLNITQIMDEKNAEIRRAMVDIYGIDRFVVDSHSRSLDKQGEYELLSVPFLQGGNMIALKMRCPTTAAVYVHTVHPDCTNVEQALAWKRGEDDFRNARPYKEGLIWEL
jgi:hypothetical protein